jgi:hypothetical protein
MNQTVIAGLLHIANRHKHHLEKSKRILAAMIPLTADHVEEFSDEDIALWDAFTMRFCKLQDLLGSKLFDAVLAFAGATPIPSTIIDKVHALEKMEIIPNAKLWQSIRDTRNNLTHDYPDMPTFTAKTLNDTFEQVDTLLKIVDAIEQLVKTQKW